jgi:hypothetical protein
MLGFAAAPSPADAAGRLRAVNLTVVSEADAQPWIAAVAPEVPLADAIGEPVARAGGWAIGFSLDVRDLWPRLPAGALWAHLSAGELCAEPLRIAAVNERDVPDVAAEPLLAAYDAARGERWAAACDAFAAAFERAPEVRADLDRPHLANAARAAARAGEFARASTWLEGHVKMCADRLAAIECELATNPTKARRELLAQRTAGVLARMGLDAGA